MSYCSQCGYILQPGWVSCPACGLRAGSAAYAAPVPVVPVGAPVSAPALSGLTVAIWLSVAVLLAAAAVVIFASVSGSSDDDAIALAGEIGFCQAVQTVTPNGIQDCQSDGGHYFNSWQHGMLASADRRIVRNSDTSATVTWSVSSGSLFTISADKDDSGAWRADPTTASGAMIQYMHTLAGQ